MELVGLKQATLTLFVLVGFGVTETALAALYDRSGGLVYDDVLNITWTKDGECKNFCVNGHEIGNYRSC
jgi:hypothetical protein